MTLIKTIMVAGERFDEFVHVELIYDCNLNLKVEKYLMGRVLAYRLCDDSLHFHSIVGWCGLKKGLD